MNHTYRPAPQPQGKPIPAQMKNRRRLSAACAAFAIGAFLACAQAHAQEGLLLYVPNYNSNSVSVFRSNADGSLAAVATIAGVGTQPSVAAVRGDQAFAYVTSNASNELRVIDTSTNTVVQTVTTGLATPYGVAVSPDGTRVYVANQGGTTVAVFSADSATGQLSSLTTITAGTAPRAVRFSADGTRAYVANQTSGTVSVINTADNSVIATVNTGGQLFDIAVNPAGTRVYAVDVAGKKVYVIDTATNSVVASPATGNGPRGVVVSADGARFYVSNYNDHTISQFDASTNASLGTVAADLFNYNPGQLAISPNGTSVYVAQGGTSDNVRIFTISSSGLLTGNGNSPAAGDEPYSVGLCGNGSGMLGSGKTFVANSANALGCTGSSASFSGGTLKVNGAGLAISTPMTLGSAGGTIDTNGNSATLSGILSGSGGLTKSGAGTLTLSGANTYTGATAVNAGTLQAGAANVFGNSSAVTVASGAVLDLNSFSQILGSLAGAGNVTLGAATLTAGGNNSSTTFSGSLSGTGGLVKTGSGTLTLSGTNSYTGGTTVSAGSLIGDSASLQGAITNNALVIFDQASNGTYAGVMGGTGGLTKSGAGTLTLTGANTYSGVTTINGGTLSVGADNNLGTGGGLAFGGGTLQYSNGFSSSRAVTLNAGGGIIDTNGNSATLSGIIGGTGGLTKSGTGTLTLSGANTYSGGTTVNAGSLLGDTASLQGAITNNATVIFDQATDGTYAGAMSGSGSLTKSGTGKTILSGTNTYTGDTNINGGILSVNGSTTSNALVNSGGTLGGSGIINGNVTVNSGGIIAPGNSPGILTVNSLTLNPGSTTRMEINGLTAGTQYDQIVVNNTATLDGTLDLVFGFTPSAGNQFSLIRAGNIASGFAAIQSTTLGAALQLRIISSATAIDMSIDQGSFVPFALTHNQQAVASMLDAQYAAWGATGLINRLDTLSAAQLPAVLGSLSGEQHAHGQFMARRVGMQFNDLLLSRLNDVDGERSHGWHFWMKGLGGFGAIEGDGNAGRADNHSGGFAMGADTGLGEHATLGAAVSYARSNVDAVTANLGMDSYQLSSYAKWQRGGNYLEGTVTGGLHQTDSRRTVFENSAAADYDSSTAGTALEAGRHIALPGAATLTPYAGMQYLHLNRDGFSETGSALANLNVREANEDSFRTLLGARLSQVVKAGWGVSIQPMLHAAWVRENADSFSRLSADFAAAPAAAYSVYGPKLERNRAAVGADLVTRFSETAQLNVAYNAELAKSDDWHTLSATFEYRW